MRYRTGHAAGVRIAAMAIFLVLSAAAFKFIAG
jgi:hypothetical protein